jgi:hypothetical protein
MWAWQKQTDQTAQAGFGGNAMNTRTGVLLLLLALGLCCAIGPAMADNSTATGMPYVSDIQPYNGPLGPDSSLYGLKLAFENLGDTFTFNQTEKLERELGHADTRISELERALAANQTDAANLAMDQYYRDLNQTERTMSRFNDTGFNPVYDYNVTGNGVMPGSENGNNGGGSAAGFNMPENMPPSDAAMLAAQQRLVLHQDILQHLIDTHPDYGALTRVYNTSLDVEKRFEDRTLVHFDLQRDAFNHIIYRPVYIAPVTHTQNMPVYTWNQSRTSTNTGNGQASQAWQNQHRQDVQVSNNPGQTPANYQEYRHSNTSTNGNDNRNDNGNGARDYRVLFP